jgi:hypothetical protein
MREALGELMRIMFIAVAIAAIAAIAAVPAAAAPKGCADHWAVELDRDSFAHNGAGRTFPAALLAAFRAKVEAQLRIAAGDACGSRKLTVARASAVRRVQVHSASGASEPHFYSDGKAKLHFEWVFAEEDLAVPPRADMVGGLICWANPSEPACADEGD